MSGLGNLERVKNIRTIWANEARDFTPWMAQDDVIALLSQAVGMGADGLEVVGTEQSVGGFKADLICKETAPPGRTVVIENQFGMTNHDHIGKLITYAAGQEAKVLILIAEEIREEHEAALDLLNEMSSDDFQVFGVEIELWRIGDSPVAPRFNIVAKPNDWKRHEKQRIRTETSSKSLTPTELLRQEFWTAVCQRVEAAQGPFNAVSPQPGSWIAHGIGKSAVGLNMVMSTRDNLLRVEIYLSGQTAKGYFGMLKHHAADLEEKIGHPLDWQILDGKKDARICLTRTNSDPTEKDDWPEQHKWLVETAISFYHAFHPYVLKLNRDEALTL